MWWCDAFVDELARLLLWYGLEVVREWAIPPDHSFFVAKVLDVDSGCLVTTYGYTWLQRRQRSACAKLHGSPLERLDLQVHCLPCGQSFVFPLRATIDFGPVLEMDVLGEEYRLRSSCKSQRRLL